MERIGIAASKMAKGNLFLYNLFVILLAFLFSLIIFVIAGATIVLALVVFASLGGQLAPAALKQIWSSVLSVCMITLTVVITIFYLLALIKNLKLHKS